jgi:hypothetical protein
MATRWAIRGSRRLSRFRGRFIVVPKLRRSSCDGRKRLPPFGFDAGDHWGPICYLLFVICHSESTDRAVIYLWWKLL